MSPTKGALLLTKMAVSQVLGQTSFGYFARSKGFCGWFGGFFDPWNVGLS
jgi:hypothetical protein